MKLHLSRPQTQISFDLTPIIDVVFLLIIFFMLVFQFFAAEQFDAELPDKIASAIAADNPVENAAVSITFMGEKIRYAVGSDILDAADSKLLEKMICSAINSRLADSAGSRTISLRCDKRVPFEKVRPALQAIARSRAEKIQWAVLP